ncbi:alpha-amylase family glycosyl hydrolase [Maridesulfovibrio bastinii]|uniref:alpha-amylase family glycosyl hydrolase n=1 Tax=Maridesulfovibrio bastinii TaxID=47157 RepID=UPI00042A72D0|nr:alpha-amylase family glycosyl hydrolase [Maridesulfovibrio bastinii]
MTLKPQGACFDSDGNCSFTIFAPENEELVLRLTQNRTKDYPMEYDNLGYHTIIIENCTDNASYCFIHNGETCLPDPASRFQPDGLTAPSRTLNHYKFDWHGDNFAGINPDEMIIYEAHIGTFTSAGNFSAAAEKLDHLAELGINTLLLMPTACFSGDRDWGYLSVFPFAVQPSYGTPSEFKEFIRICHQKNIAVVLEISLSSITPQGNMFCSLAPFGSSCHISKEGPDINFDGQFSYGIRDFYLQSCLSWLIDYHADGLKIACEDKIIDNSPIHFLSELSANVKEIEDRSSKKYLLATENSCGGLTSIRSREKGGYGFNALCSDDFHNAVFAAASKSQNGVYAEYGCSSRIAETLQKGRCFHGEFSKARHNFYGQPGEEEGKFIVYSLDHRLAGRNPGKSRTVKALGFRGAKLCAGATLLAPSIPLLFMGEELGAENCFHFFSSPYSKKLSETLLNARQNEVGIYNPETSIPDPEHPDAFAKSVLNWDNLKSEQCRYLFNLYRDLIALRKVNQALRIPAPARSQVINIQPDTFLMVRNRGANVQVVAAIFNFSDQEQSCNLSCYLPEKTAVPLMCSETETYGGQFQLPEILSPQKELVQPAKSFTVIKMVNAD